MSATHDDEQSLKISKAIGRRCRPYTDRDIARATRGHRRLARKPRHFSGSGGIACSTASKMIDILCTRSVLWYSVSREHQLSGHSRALCHVGLDPVGRSKSCVRKTTNVSELREASRDASRNAWLERVKRGRSHAAYGRG